MTEGSGPVEYREPLWRSLVPISAWLIAALFFATETSSQTPDYECARGLLDRLGRGQGIRGLDRSLAVRRDRGIAGDSQTRAASYSSDRR